MYIVVSGNIVDGLGFFGPFENAETANEWADDNFKEWIVTELEATGEEENHGA